MPIAPDAEEAVVKLFSQTLVALGSREEEAYGAIRHNPAVEANGWLGDGFPCVRWSDVLRWRDAWELVVYPGLGFKLAAEQLEEHERRNLLVDAIRVAGMESFKSMPELQFPKSGFNAPAAGIEIEQDRGGMLFGVGEASDEDSDGTVWRNLTQEPDGYDG